MLVTLLVSLVILALVYWLVSLLPLKAPFDRIIQVLFVIIAIILILRAFGILPASLNF